MRTCKYVLTYCRHCKPGKRAVSRYQSAQPRLLLEEAQEPNAWADDLKLGLEQEIKVIDGGIKKVRRTAAASSTLETGASEMSARIGNQAQQTTQGAVRQAK